MLPPGRQNPHPHLKVAIPITFVLNDLQNQLTMDFKYPASISFLLLLFPISFSSLAQEPPTEKGQIIRVLSYNILHGATTTGQHDLNQVARVINQINPDIIALQEVDFRTNRSNKRDIATELAVKTGMVPAFAKAVDYDGGEYGQAILSRWTFAKTGKIALPGQPEKEPRIAIEAVIPLPSGDTIRFVGTHLDHVKDDKDRRLQAEELNKLLVSNAYPVILAGDLNDVPGSAPINKLQSKWGAAFNIENPEPTFPSQAPKVKIDYVMFSPKERWKVRETKFICDEVASDHCAYLVVLELIP